MMTYPFDHAALRGQPTERTHRRLIDACAAAARIPGTAHWYSAHVAHLIDNQRRDPWSLTFNELQALMNTADQDLRDPRPRTPTQ